MTISLHHTKRVRAENTTAPKLGTRPGESPRACRPNARTAPIAGRGARLSKRLGSALEANYAKAVPIWVAARYQRLPLRSPKVLGESPPTGRRCGGTMRDDLLGLSDMRMFPEAWMSRAPTRSAAAARSSFASELA